MSPREHIRQGASREDALSAFQQLVNRPNTLFSRDSWLKPKIQHLSEVLPERLEVDHALGLLDVLFGRRLMTELLDWIKVSGQVGWVEFPEYRKEMENEQLRKQADELKRKDQAWSKNGGRPNYENDILTLGERIAFEAESVGQAKAKFLSQASPCPACETKPNDLEWFRWSSSPSSWAFHNGRAGFRTRCLRCNQNVDFFVTKGN